MTGREWITWPVILRDVQGPNSQTQNQEGNVQYLLVKLQPWVWRQWGMGEIYPSEKKSVVNYQTSQVQTQAGRKWWHHFFTPHSTKQAFTLLHLIGSVPLPFLSNILRRFLTSFGHFYTWSLSTLSGTFCSYTSYLWLEYILIGQCLCYTSWEVNSIATPPSDINNKSHFQHSKRLTM